MWKPKYSGDFKKLYGKKILVTYGYKGEKNSEKTEGILTRIGKDADNILSSVILFTGAQEANNIKKIRDVFMKNGLFFNPFFYNFTNARNQGHYFSNVKCKVLSVLTRPVPHIYMLTYITKACKASLNYL